MGNYASVGGWAVNVTGSSSDPFATVTARTVGTLAGGNTAQLTPAGIASVTSYAATYFTDGTFSADPRVPSLQVSSGGIVITCNVADATTVANELVSLLTEAGNLS